MKARILLASLALISSSAIASVVTGFDGVKVNVPKPQRIVAINSTTTEILFVLGAGDRVVGREDSVVYPAKAKSIPSVGHPYYPSVEGIISLKPDVVVGTKENLPPASITQLRSANVPVLVLEPSDLDGVDGYKRRVRMLAELVDQQEKAQEEIGRFDAVLKAVEAGVKKSASRPRVFFFYSHGPAAGYIYGNHTGPHYLIEAAGGENAAQSVEGVKTFTQEAMINTQPDVILVLERVSKNLGGPAAIARTPGIALTPAGRNKKVIEMEETIRSIGPRFAEFVKELNTKLQN